MLCDLEQIGFYADSVQCQRNASRIIQVGFLCFRAVSAVPTLLKPTLFKAQ